MNIRNHKQQSRALTLTDLLVCIMIIGTITAFAMPSISTVFDSANDAKARENARNVESMSGQLASLGVAHVIPDSLGGVEATVRLFRVGVTVPEGPMEGQVFIIKAISDEDVVDIKKYLRVRYDATELRLEFVENTDPVGGFIRGLFRHAGVDNLAFVPTPGGAR